MGLRVEAVWVPPEELGPTMASVQVLPPQRRARRRLRDLQGVPVSEFPELVSGRRPVGVVSFAQYDNVRREDARNEVEMLMPVVAEVFGNIGITKDDVGFICSGSTDYLDRRPVLLRRRARRRRRVAAPGRVPRRDGRRLGALRGLGAAPGGRDRRRPRLLLRAFVDGRPQPRSCRAARPVLPGPAVARPDLAGRAAGPGHDRRGQGHRGRLRRRGQPLPPLGALATPRPRSPTTARPRSCWPRTTRWRRCAATRCRR